MTPTSRPRLLVAVAALVALLALVAVPGAQAKSSGRHHARSADRNRDRIPDRWERRFHLSLTRDQARRDQDHDGLRNRAEYLARTDPRDADTDGDGRRDGREDAGQVVSFDGTTLVVKSFGGATVTGTLSAATELRCRSAGDLETEAEAGDERGARAASDDGPGDDHGARSGRGGQDDPSGDDQSGDGAGDDAAADGAGDDASGPDACPAGALAAGATVHEARLAVTSTGNEWREVELVAPKAA